MTTPQPAPNRAQRRRPSGLAVNTNLEQISDWLTKILVGVGLTQLYEIFPRMWRIGQLIGPSIGASPVAAVALITNFLVWGFFCGYLLTRLFLSSAFSLADDAEAELSEREQSAYSLTKQGAHPEAAEEYAIAVEQLTPDTPAPQRRAVYEGAMYNWLYTGNFAKVIQYGRTYFSDPKNPASGRIWAYLAMGYGQQFADEVEKGMTGQLMSIRKLAYDAVRQAIQAEPKLKSLLRMVWDPNDPTKLSSEEDDLEVFFGDPEFRQALDDGSSDPKVG